jgi:hypothetical protein
METHTKPHTTKHTSHDTNYKNDVVTPIEFQAQVMRRNQGDGQKNACNQTNTMLLEQRPPTDPCRHGDGGVHAEAADGARGPVPATGRRRRGRAHPRRR